mgnify:CR=1 FL=1
MMTGSANLVARTGDVEGSYFKILGRLKKEDLPTIDTVIPPINIGLQLWPGASS